jgi:hypothetical protein
MHVCKKYEFQKYRNWVKFSTKWFSIINFLKNFKNLGYNKSFKVSYFLLYLSLILYVSNNVKRYKLKFNPRTLVYIFIYLWLGKAYFFPFFTDSTIFLKHVYLFIAKLTNLSFNYFFISNNDISAKFLANYICLKLKKYHYLFSILNPVKRELCILSRESKKVKTTFII